MIRVSPLHQGGQYRFKACVLPMNPRKDYFQAFARCQNRRVQVFPLILLMTGFLAGKISSKFNELRVHLFADAADTTLNQPLTEQRRSYGLGSIGIGVRARILDHASATVEDAYTLRDAITTKHGADALLFRVIGDF